MSSFVRLLLSYLLTIPPSIHPPSIFFIRFIITLAA